MLDQTFGRVYTKFKLHFYKQIFSRFEDREATLTTVESFCMEVIMAFLIYKVAGTLRYMGYRSAMLGPDGLYPNYRLLFLAVCGALTFLLTFTR